MASIFRLREDVIKSVDEMVANADPDTDLIEEIPEKADELVPVYNHNVVDEWMSVDEYDSENYCGEFNIIAQMKAVLYEWYSREIHEELSARGLV